MSPSITAQRNGENRQGLKVRRRNQWGARRSYTDARAVQAATKLFFHITVTNPRNYNSNDAHARGLEAIGIARFPNTGISYNMLVMPDASIYEAQPLGRRGAHTVNDFRRSSCVTSGCPSQGQPLTATSWNLNYNSRAVAIAQNVNDPVTLAQIQSVAKCGAAWKREGFVSSGARWHGHRCVSAKSCPGDKAWQHITRLHHLTEEYTRNGLGGGTAPKPEPEPEPEEANMTPRSIWRWAGLDYVNKKATTKDNQLARSHQYGYRIRQWLGSHAWLRDNVGRAVLLAKNSVNDKTMSLMLRQNNEALTKPIKSPISGDPISVRRMQQLDYGRIYEIGVKVDAIIDHLEKDANGPLHSKVSKAVDQIEAAMALPFTDEVDMKDHPDSVPADDLVSEDSDDS